jgi:hypothetical protein
MFQKLPVREAQSVLSGRNLAFGAAPLQNSDVLERLLGSNACGPPDPLGAFSEAEHRTVGFLEAEATSQSDGCVYNSVVNGYPARDGIHVAEASFRRCCRRLFQRNWFSWQTPPHESNRSRS